MIHLVFGTRAQVIKVAPLMTELARRKIEYNFIFTQQHHETMYSMLDMYGVKHPDVVLGNIGKDITAVKEIIPWYAKIISQTFREKEKIFQLDPSNQNRKDIVLIHGDAPPALLGAMMAKIARLPIAHIESGLRSFNIFNPFPEELIRLLTFPLVKYFFVQGDWAAENVKKYSGEIIDTKVNTLYDTLNMALSAESSVEIPDEKYCVFSSHRFENITNAKRFTFIINTLKQAASKMKVLFILHPVTRKKLKDTGIYQELENHPNIELQPRYDNYDWMHLLKNSEFIITDGGSNQEESSYMGKPCLLLRTHTERQEGLNSNVVLSSFSQETVDQFIDNYPDHSRPPLKLETSPSSLIIDTLSEYC